MLSGFQGVAAFCVVGLAASLPVRGWAMAQDDAGLVELSKVVNTDGGALRSAPGGGDIPLIIDTNEVTPLDAHLALFAVQDANKAGRKVIAVVEGDVTGGAAVVAAACQGIALLPDGQLTSCADAWCESPAMREAMAKEVASSGGRDPMIASRLLGGTEALSHSKDKGVQQGNGGETILAAQGKPMTLDAAVLQTLGWAGPPHADRAAALAAIAAGIGNPPPVGRPPFGGGAKQPAGKQPAPPSGKPGVPPPAGKQGATPPSPAGQGVGALPGPAAQKLSAIKTDLAELKALIEEFNLYFSGKKGVWDQKSKSLEEVWRKKEMTKDPDTRQRCRTLQSDMNREAETIETDLTGIKVAAKGALIPCQKQLDELAKELLAFKSSLSLNKPDSYKKSSSAILNTKIP
jgi:hypothetical protein